MIYLMQVLGPYGEQAEAYVDVRGLSACYPNQDQAMPFEKQREFFMRVADHLGLGVGAYQFERLSELVRFYSHHPPEKWCVCEHVAHEVPEKDHKANCPRRQEMKRQRLELERVEREVLEEVERVEREEVERRQAIDQRARFARQLAAQVSTHFEDAVAQNISHASLAHIAQVIAAEQERRRKTTTSSA